MGVRYPIQRALYGNGNSVVCNADGSVDMFAANGQPVTTHEDRLRVTQGPIEQPGLSGVALSAAGEGRFWFDSGTNHWMYSENHGAATQAFGVQTVTPNATINRVPYLSAANVYSDSPVSVQSGMVGINLGAIAPPTMFTVGDTLNSTPRGLMSWQASTDANSAHFHLRKSRGTFAAPTVVVTADVMGRIVFSGYDGASYNESAYIRATVTGTVAANRVPSKMEFFTSTDAAPSVATVALTLNADQSAVFTGAVSAPSIAIAGTNGAGFASFVPQTPSNPTTPGSGFVLFADSAGKLSYRRPDGFVRKFDFGSPTADRTITFVDSDVTVFGATGAVTTNRLGRITATGVIGNSLLSDDGTNVSMTSGQVYAADGSAALPAYSFGTRTNWGFYNGGSANGIVVSIAGSTVASYTNGQLNIKSSLSFGTDGLAATQDVILGRAAAANLRFGAADAAAPVAQMLSVQSVVAGTSNTAGVDWTFNGSQGTGTGAGGKFVFKGAAAGSTGTAQNALSTLFTIDPATGVTLGSGQILLPNGSATNPALAFSGNTNTGFRNNSGSDIRTVVAGFDAVIQNQTTLNLQSASGCFSIGASGGDSFLCRDAANTLALRNGANAQTFRVYNTFTDASNNENAQVGWGNIAGSVFGIKIVGNGTGSSNRAIGFMTGNAAINFYTGNSTSQGFQVSGAGHFLALTDNTYDIGQSGANRPRNLYVAGTGTFGGSLQGGSLISLASASIANGGGYSWGSGRSAMWSAADGNIHVTNAAGTSFNLFQFGGTTSFFPALKRNGANLEAKLADDSAYTGIAAIGVNLQGVTIANLPASPAAGMTRYVTDGDSGLAWGATAVNSGAGTTKYLVWYNGSAWTIVGK